MSRVCKAQSDESICIVSHCEIAMAQWILVSSPTNSCSQRTWKRMAQLPSWPTKLLDSGIAPEVNLKEMCNVCTFRPRLNKAACSGFKSSEEVSPELLVALQKGLMSSKHLKKRNGLPKKEWKKILIFTVSLL